MNLETTALALASRERLLLLSALGGVALLAWVYLLHHAAMPMMQVIPHGWQDFGLLLVMWMVMMAAMMLPTVIPTVLVHAAASRHLAAEDAAVRNVAFVGGYLLAWSVFSIGAALLQLWLGGLALLSPQMRAASPLVGAALLACAGSWQLTPLKEACLRRCRMPLQFVAEHWRAGAGGALHMGWWHGFYCIGCCGGLMMLLFVGGVMNLLWVALISAFVLVEKTAFPGSRTGRWLSGIGLLAAAGFLLVA